MFACTWFIPNKPGLVGYEIDTTYRFRYLGSPLIHMPYPFLANSKKFKFPFVLVVKETPVN